LLVTLPNSPSLKRWIHLDPSEGIANTPLVYSTGWSKALSYVLAFSLSGAADVTPIYLPPLSLADSSSSPNTTLALPRERISEPGLRRALEAVTEGRRRGLSKEERRELEEGDEREQAWKRDESGKRGEEERMRREKQGEMGGRVSGTKEWRTLRGEGVGRDGLRQEAEAGGGAAGRGSSMMDSKSTPEGRCASLVVP
jgi:peptide-N4-(N-acetyl-beta-glucosaminyl)asparagine amidase